MPTLCNFHKSPSRAGTGQSQGSRSPGQCATYSSYSAFSGGALSRVRIFQVSWKYCDAYQIVQYDCQSRPESFEFVQDLNILAVSPPDWRRPKRTCQTWGVVCRRRQTDQLFSYKTSIFGKSVMYSCFLWCEAPPSFTNSLESWQLPSEFICSALSWCQLQEIFLLEIFGWNSDNRLHLKSEKIWEQIGFDN